MAKKPPAKNAAAIASRVCDDAMRALSQLEDLFTAIDAINRLADMEDTSISGLAEMGRSIAAHAVVELDGGELAISQACRMENIPEVSHE